MSSDINNAEIPQGVTLYDWEDFDTSRNLIQNDVKDTLAKQFALKEHNGVQLSITDLKYVDPEHYSISDQKKALHNDDFLARRLRGTVTLKDSNTGELLDQKEMTLLKVPYLTGRGTFIRDGNEWGTINQTRLIPGAYSRYQNNGDLETQFNVRPGTGGSFKVNLDPTTAIYKFKTAGQEFHMYSLLHDIGISDERLRNSWGDEIFEKNKSGYDNRTLEKAYQKIVPDWDRKANPGRTDEEKVQLIKNALNRAQMATQVAKITLPNLFDRTKSASWRDSGFIMEKCASLNAEDLRDIAAYINEAANKNIDLDASKEDLEEQIKSIALTGKLPGEVGEVDDPVIMAVNNLKRQRVIAKLKTKLENKYGY